MNTIYINITFMNIRSLNLNLLIAFNALLSEKNVSKAAKKVHLTQPAMSHALEKLRKIFDDRILVRTPTGMEPTTLANSIHGEVKLILNQVDALLNKKRTFDPKISKREFRIGVSTAGEIVFIPKLIQFLSKKKSQITISTRFVTQQISQLLEQGELDLALTGSYDVPSHLNTEVLMQGKYVCVTSQNHPILGLEKNLKHYLQFPHIIAQREENDINLVDVVLEKLNKERETMLRTNQLLSLHLILPHTNLIATVNEELGSYYTKYWKLAVWPCPVPLPPYEIIQVWHQRNDSDPAFQWLRNFFKEVSAK